MWFGLAGLHAVSALARGTPDVLDLAAEFFQIRIPRANQRDVSVLESAYAGRNLAVPFFELFELEAERIDLREIAIGLLA